MRGRALAALVLGAVVIGGSPILVRVSSVGPLATSFWRLSLALAPLWYWFQRSARDHTAGRIPRLAKEHVAAALPGVFLAADLAAWQTSLHMTSVANATLLVNVAPILTTLAGWLFLRQAVSGVFFAGLVLSMAGIVVLRGGPSAMAGGAFRGDALALVAAAFYAGYLLFLGRARQTYQTAVIMLWSTTSAALCTLPLVLVFETTLWPSTASGWAVLFALAWIGHAGGQGLVTFSLAWLPTNFASLTLLIQPVVAACLAWLLLGESLGASQIVGGLIVIAGIMLARRG
jgi:drug/metabolite transporter (DMT)-like permease